MKPSEVLLRAADEMETRGKSVEEYIDNEGHVCAIGSIRLACGAKVVDYSTISELRKGLYLNMGESDYDVSSSREARRILSQFLEAHGADYGWDSAPDTTIISWNDRSTQETVVSTLRAAAEWAKECGE